MRTPRFSLATAAILGAGTIGLAASPAHAAGTTLFVNGASGCSDQTTDSSVHAYCTVHAAVAAVQPGQTVQIAGGSYTDSVTVTVQGTAEAPVTITAAPGTSVTIGNTPSVGHLVDFENASYVTLTGVRLAGGAKNQAVLVNGSSHIGFKSDIFMATTSVGVQVTGSDATSVTQGLVTAGAVDGVVVDGGSTNTVVGTTFFVSRGRAVHVHGASGTAVTGITTETACGAGVEVDNGSTNTTVENDILGAARVAAGSTCVSTDPNKGDLSVAADSVATTHVASNLLDPVASGGTVYRWGDQTFAQAADFQTASGQGAGDLVATPMVDANGRPQDGSPAVDSADSGAPGEQDVDLAGHARVLDPTVSQTGVGPRSYDDRGAYEFQDPFRPSGLTTVQDGVSPTATLTVQTTGWHPASSYTFDFGDGHPVTQDSPTITHTFGPGRGAGTLNYMVKVTATESVTGNQSTANFEAPIVNAAPTPSGTPTNTLDADGFYSVSVDASGSTAGSLPIASYTLTVTDNDPNYPFSRTVTQASPDLKVDGLPEGDYKVDISASDAEGTPGTLEIAHWSVPTRSAGSVTVHRVAGADRYLTGAAVSQQLWADAGMDGSGRRNADAVVLATGASFADAVAGVPLAAKVNGPLLLTEPGALTSSTEAEITRILPAHVGQKVYVLGGSNAISPTVDAKLEAMGYTVVRFAGSDRFATAVEIAQQEFLNDGPVYVATGLDFPDALAAGPLAAANIAPVVLSDGVHLTDDTARYLESHDYGNWSAVAVGGAADQAMYRIPHQTLSGADRYGTAAAVASAFPQLSAVTSTGIATGDNYADALTGGAMMATLHQPLLLTAPNALPGQDGTLLARWIGLRSVSVFGGSGVVSNAVVKQIVAVVAGRIV